MPQPRIRYAVAGLGWIAQETILPAFRNTSNSELAALVTSDPAKARDLAAAYNVPRAVAYDEYEDLLQSGDIDAVFIALPNSLHADFATRAAENKVHVLCEKPLASNVAECNEIIAAAAENGVKLMTGYRLHFETATLSVVEAVTSGRIGEPRAFHSTFGQQVAGGNSRLSRELGGGPLPDMGVYPINAARCLFRAEPVEVMAFGGKTAEARFSEVHEAVSALLRFPGDRQATFTCSFGMDPIDTFTINGTKGFMRLSPAYGFRGERRVLTSINGEEREEAIPEYDQFGGEIEYFSRCILEDRAPGPSGYEGLADMRVVDALLESMHTRRPVQLPAFSVAQRPEQSSRIELPAVRPELLKNVGPPSTETR